MPLSLTLIHTSPALTSARSAIVPSSGVNLTALLSTLLSADCIRAASTYTSGASGGMLTLRRWRLASAREVMSCTAVWSRSASGVQARASSTRPCSFR